MKKMNLANSRLTLVVLGLASVGMTAFASTNNCPVTTGTLATRTFTGGPTYTNIVVPGGTSGSPLPNSFTALGTAGCTAIDLTFSNFALTSTGTNEGNLPSIGGTYVSVSPNNTTQTDPDTLLFSTLQGEGTGPDNAPNDGVDNTKLNASHAFTTTASYGVSESTAAGIFEVLLTLNDITISSGGSGSVAIDTCSKGSTVITGPITSASACTSAAAGAVFQSTTITLAQLASQTASLNFATPPGYVDVTQVISLTCSACGTNETGFLTFSNEFFETPEPSTFALLGTALAAVSLMGFIKRKLRS